MSQVTSFDWASLLAEQPLLPLWQPTADTPLQDWAEHLAKAGYRAVEIPLRDPFAWKALAQLKQAPVCLIAGSVTQLAQLDRLVDLGISLAVSPGWNLALAQAARERGIRLLPGVMTASEAMQAQMAGFNRVKFFPAAAMGRDYFQALRAPFPELGWVPTGGLNAQNLANWLALPGVAGVGGSWMMSSQEAATQALQQVNQWRGD